MASSSLSVSFDDFTSGLGNNSDRSFGSSTPSSSFNSPSALSSTLPDFGGSNTRREFNHKQFIDSLVKSLLLAPEQAADLHQIAKWGNKLELGDLLIRLSSFGWQFRTQNILANIVQKENKITSVLDQVGELLEKKWQMNEVQSHTLLVVAKDAIFNPQFSDYKKLSSRVRIAIEKMDEFKAVFDKPHRMSILDTEISKKCRNISNQFRKAIKLTTLGDERLCLDEAVVELAKKFLLGGAIKINHEHKTRVAILRRFARENPQVLNFEESDDEEGNTDGEGDSDAETSRQENGRKRRKGQSKKSKKKVGRYAKGQDWWSLVEKWFKAKTVEWGKDDSVGWKNYITETLAKERALEAPNNIELLPTGSILSSINVPAFDADRYDERNDLSPSLNSEPRRSGSNSSQYHTPSPSMQQRSFGNVHAPGPQFIPPTSHILSPNSGAQNDGDERSPSPSFDRRGHGAMERGGGHGYNLNGGMSNEYGYRNDAPQHFPQYNGQSYAGHGGPNPQAGTSSSSVMGLLNGNNNMNGQPQRHLTGSMGSGAAAYRATGTQQSVGGMAPGHFGAGQEVHVGWNTGH